MHTDIYLSVSISVSHSQIYNLMPVLSLENYKNDTLSFMTPSMMTLITYPCQLPVPVHYRLTLAEVFHGLTVFSIKMLPFLRDSYLTGLPITTLSCQVDVVFCTIGHPLKGSGV